MTGWNLPPGCSVKDIDDQCREEPCACCGQDPYECICPECPYCGKAGDPACYNVGHDDTKTDKIVRLKYTRQQLIGQQRMKILDLEDQLGDARYVLEMLEAWSDEEDEDENR